MQRIGPPSLMAGDAIRTPLPTRPKPCSRLRLKLASKVILAVLEARVL